MSFRVRCCVKGWIVGLVTVALAAWPAFAGPTSPSCLSGSRAGASLLFPYFEVDLASPDGTTTLLSIGNASDEPLLAHVVVWTDWGLPTTTFDLALDANQVQSLNLRSVFAGQLPVTGEGLDGRIEAPNCTFPIRPLPIDVAELAARHTGQPSPFSGLCYGSGRGGRDMAIGYLTVDVVRDCSDALPADPGYFVNGEGLATNDNLIFGEFFLLESSEDFAQGMAAVPLVADVELFSPEAGAVRQTFYKLHVEERMADDRAPLSWKHRARFLDGGGFGGTTDVLIWTGGIGLEAVPQECGTGPYEGTNSIPHMTYEFRDEAGETLLQESGTAPAAVFRLSIGGDELPLEPGKFGTLDIESRLFGCINSLPCVDPLQSWVGSLIRASGRFSVGVEATRLVDLCQNPFGS